METRGDAGRAAHRRRATQDQEGVAEVYKETQPTRRSSSWTLLSTVTDDAASLNLVAECVAIYA